MGTTQLPVDVYFVNTPITKLLIVTKLWVSNKERRFSWIKDCVLTARDLDTEPKIVGENPRVKIVTQGIIHHYATEFKHVSQVMQVFGVVIGSVQDEFKLEVDIMQVNKRELLVLQNPCY